MVTSCFSTNGKGLETLASFWSSTSTPRPNGPNGPRPDHRGEDSPDRSPDRIARLEEALVSQQELLLGIEKPGEKWWWLDMISLINHWVYGYPSMPSSMADQEISCKIRCRVSLKNDPLPCLITGGNMFFLSFFWRYKAPKFHALNIFEYDVFIICSFPINSYLMSLTNF